MKPTEILENEHRIIEQVLSALETMADQNESSKKLDCGAARDMIEFFRMFADRFHHAKEERHLFACLEAHGMPRDGGPTGVMLSEHEMGREFVAKMDQAVNVYEHGNVAGLKDFVKAARSYVPLLREHIQKEDHCLFAITNQSLSRAEQENLMKAFREEEAQSAREKPLDYYPRKAQELARRFPACACHSQDGAPRACGSSCGGF